MSGFYTKYVILKHALIFQFGIKLCFFQIPIIFTNFLVRLSIHFFDFLSYMAGKCIFVWKVEFKFKKIKKCVILKHALIFQFGIKSCFFPIPIIFTNFLVALSSHFLDFWLYMAGNCIFWCQIWPKNAFSAFIVNDFLKDQWKCPDIFQQFLRFPDK